MIKRLIRKCALHLLSLTDDAESEPSKANHSSPAFEKKGRELIAAREKNKAITAGSIQLLGLNDIKQQAGANWPHLSSRVNRVADRMIRKHLTSDDIYTQQGDDTFVLFFGSMGEREASDKAERISKAIRRAVASAVPEATAINVSHFVAEIDPQIFDENRPDGSLTEAICATLSNIRSQSRAVAAKRRASLLRMARFLFKPVWSPVKRAAVFYRCMLDAGSGKAALEQLAAISNPEELRAAISDLDSLLLGKAVEALHQVLQRDMKSIVIIPVHFSTLTTELSAAEYVRLCVTIPDPYRKFVFFELHGIPQRTAAGRLSELAHLLKPFCHGVLLQSAEPNLNILQLLAAGFTGLSFDMPSVHDPVETSIFLKRSASIMRAKNRIMLVHGANTISQLEMAVKAGVDYVSGEAVHANLDEPRGAFRFTPVSLMDGSGMFRAVGAGRDTAPRIAALESVSLTQ